MGLFLASSFSLSKSKSPISLRSFVESDVATDCTARMRSVLDPFQFLVLSVYRRMDELVSSIWSRRIEFFERRSAVVGCDNVAEAQVKFDFALSAYGCRPFDLKGRNALVFPSCPPLCNCAQMLCRISETLSEVAIARSKSSISMPNWAFCMCFKNRFS
jgi:hypothetical protein